MYLKIVVLALLFVCVVNANKTAQINKLRGMQVKQHQNLKDEFAFSSLRNDIKYKYYKMAKVDEANNKLKMQKELEYLKKLEQQKREQAEKLYKKLLLRGHVSVLRDFYSPVFKK